MKTSDIGDSYPKAYLYRRIVRAKLFIDENYTQEIDLNEIADEAYFSKYHFIRQFKKIYGKTPHQYLTGTRIKRAQELLAAGRSVGEVCQIIGFHSLSSFSGLFKRQMGISPSKYQTQQRQIREEITKSPLKFIPECFSHKKGWK